MKIRKSHIVAVAAIAFAAIANPQTATSQATSPKTPAPMASGSNAPTQVETWTKKQWNAAQKEWAKDKTKWLNCQKQSGDRHLDGRKSWSFLYTCMTS